MRKRIGAAFLLFLWFGSFAVIAQDEKQEEKAPQFSADVAVVTVNVLATTGRPRAIWSRNRPPSRRRSARPDGLAGASMTRDESAPRP